MATSLAHPAPGAPVNRLEHVRCRMAKVLNPVEDVQAVQRQRIGAALRRAARQLDLSDKEACALLGDIDKGQWSRWCAGAENVVLARIYGTPLHGAFAVEQARDSQDCTVETLVRRSA